MDLQDAVDVYRELARFPSVTLARISNRDTPGHVRIYSEWSQRDLERFEKVKFARNHIVHLDDVFSTPPTDIGNVSLNAESPSGKYRANLRVVKNKKGDKEQYIEIWDDSSKLHNINVELVEQHGKVYEDGQFGCFEWSHSETHLLYVAERKRPKAKSYFDKKAAEEEEKKGTGEIARGEEWVFSETWGEQMGEKSHPVLCVLDVEDGAVSTLDNLPENVSPGQAIWCPSDQGIVCVGWDHEPYRLGLIYCPIRKNALYYIDLKTYECKVLGGQEPAVRSPVFSLDKTKMVYLDNMVGMAHQHCSRLVMVDWSTKGVVPVVEVIKQPEDIHSFPGLYLMNMRQRCWASDSKRIVLESQWRSRRVLVVINVETGKVTRITTDDHYGGWRVLDVCKDLVVAVTSSPNQPEILMLGLLPPEGKEASIRWTQLDAHTPVLSDIKWSVLPMMPDAEHIHPDFSGLDYESILLEPATPDPKHKPTLAVYPHGGPASAFAAEFALYFAGLVKCGFAVLACNYRGSVGFGDDGINSLVSRVGTQDVSDCQNAVKKVLETGRFDKDRVVVIGGSHGGFLTAHLIGQFPDFYKAAVMRNPVVNIGAKMTGSDFPDGCTTQIGKMFEFTDTPSPDLYTEMWNRSPIQFADQVKTPTMIMIGADDRRVPPEQGHEFRKALQARGIPVRVLEYTGNDHPLNKVDAESDAFINIIKWFTTYVK